MKSLGCSCDICEELKDFLCLHKTCQKVWQHLVDKNRKCEIIRRNKAAGVLIAEVMTSFRDDPNWLLYQEFNDRCYLKAAYHNFSELPSACRAALLCKEVHVPPLDLPVLDMNFLLVPGETDVFKIKPKQ